MSQVTLRDLPEGVEAHLRERARLEGRSLSKVAAELLAEASGLAGSADPACRRRRDLSRFAGSWSAEEAAAFAASAAIFEAIDEEAWP